MHGRLSDWEKRAEKKVMYLKLQAARYERGGLPVPPEVSGYLAKLLVALQYRALTGSRKRKPWRS